MGVQNDVVSRNQFYVDFTSFSTDLQNEPGRLVQFFCNVQNPRRKGHA